MTLRFVDRVLHSLGNLPHFGTLPYLSYPLGLATLFPFHLSITQSQTLDLTLSHCGKLRNLTLFIEYYTRSDTTSSLTRAYTFILFRYGPLYRHYFFLQEHFMTWRPGWNRI
jgi:hypothetical protein